MIFGSGIGRYLFNMAIFKYNRKAFTLVELIISLGIFVVITLLLISNFKIGDRRSALRMSAQEIASVLRRAQNLSLTASPLSNGTIPAAYGVRFAPDTSSYFLFADLSSPANNIYDTSSDQVVINYNLSDEIYISAVNVPQIKSGSCQAVNPPNLDIAFTVPEAFVYFNGVQPLGQGNESDSDYCGPYNPTWVELSSRTVNNKIKVYVNWISGQISISDLY